MPPQAAGSLVRRSDRRVAHPLNGKKCHVREKLATSSLWACFWIVIADKGRSKAVRRSHDAQKKIAQPYLTPTAKGVHRLPVKLERIVNGRKLSH